ncbi:hypothetical protein [Streptomyces sp. NPDC102487]|uniref:hypothetical protein n=1 Tax=Streptomyces sp. NPDC102487 TaxID=3366182 RepID=UPI003822B91C
MTAWDPQSSLRGTGRLRLLAARREAYANDQGAPSSLIAVPWSSNGSEADKDPAEWLPVPADRCTYATDGVADKLRWQLTADAAERDALAHLA